MGLEMLYSLGSLELRLPGEGKMRRKLITCRDLRTLHQRTRREAEDWMGGRITKTADKQTTFEKRFDGKRRDIMEHLKKVTLKKFSF